MTAIAWDGETLAADGLLTFGSSVGGTRTQKIYRSSDFLVEQWTMLGETVLAFGFSGDIGAHLPLISALNDVLTYETPFPRHMLLNAILITEGGDCWMYQKQRDNEFGTLYLVDMPYFSIGSGGDAATAAMIAGRNALDAVAIAMDCDVYTGGELHAWTPNRITANGRTQLQHVEGQDLWYPELEGAE
ncbi:TPA: hypothetical protein JG832_002507 [Enterobacter hormaechei subsp. xiangfangensis]|nr:hypothetical protein [Enterobacter hormaechei subsp. xiangfangensis]HAV1890642.1 hypothetical protein [Enterobacter hormaechei subsp. xiangfangensis]